MSGDFGSKRVSGLHEEVMRYEFKWRCRECGHKWKRTIATDDPLSVEDPACPACKKRKKAAHGLQDIITSQQAPAYTGQNVRIQAADQAAEIVMQDHGLTNLQGPTDTRIGESSIPKLPPAQQRMADLMFQPQKQMQAAGLGNKAGMIARQAMAGGYSAAATGSPDPIAMAQAPRKTVAEIANVMNDAKGN
jgi:hypothetical protein